MLIHSYAVVFLFFTFSSALSGAATDVLRHLSNISDALDTNQAAIDNYKGGMIAAAQLGHNAYDLWRSLRVAEASLNNSTHFTSDESDTILQHMQGLNDGSIICLDSYRDKAALLQESGLGFLAPMLLQAMFRSADDYVVSLTALMPREFAPRMAQLTAQHKEAWDMTMAAFDTEGEEDPARKARKFVAMVSPILGPVL